MKKGWMIVVGGLLIGLIGAGVYLYISQNTSVVSPKGAEGDVTPTPGTMLTWNDPAGFTLTYPEGLSVNKHDEDTLNYAHVEFTAPGKSGSVVVWVKDIPKGVTDTSTWVKKDPAVSAGTAFDTTLGGQPAQKVLLANSPKKQIVGSIFDDALFYVETILDADNYWQTTTNQMLQSFTFKPINITVSNPGTGSAPDDSSAVDEEEILQ